VEPEAVETIEFHSIELTIDFINLSHTFEIKRAIAWNEAIRSNFYGAKIDEKLGKCKKTAADNYRYSASWRNFIHGCVTPF